MFSEIILVNAAKVLKREKERGRDALLRMNPWSRLWALSACSGLPDILTTPSVVSGVSSTRLTVAPEICLQFA